MTESSKTQKILSDDAPAFVTHEYRIQHLEARVTAVEKMHDVLVKLNTSVQVLSDRVCMMLWIGGVIATGIILSIIGAITALLVN